MSQTFRFNSIVLSCLLCIVAALSAYGQEDVLAKEKEVIDANIPVYYSDDGAYALMTGDRHTGLVLLDLQTKKSVIVSTEKGDGYYATISPNNDYVCYKTFRQTAPTIEQQPRLFDIKAGVSIPLADWSRLAGTPAVSDSGLIAFTNGNSLTVLNAAFKTIASYELGHHVNLLSFSPEGQMIAFNNTDHQIVVLSLDTADMTSVGNLDGNFWGPQFSPTGDALLFNGVDGTIYLSTLDKSEPPVLIGKGSQARWLNNNSVSFIQKTVEHFEVKKTEVIKVSRQGNILATTSLNHGDAEIALSASGAIVNISGNLTKRSGNLLAKSLITDLETPTLQHSAKQDVKVTSLIDKGATREIEGVPVIHQVYDVSNWYWGHWACGPTAALMCIQYYATLPKATFDCTHYSDHKSNYGTYICDEYSFNGYTYDVGSFQSSPSPGYTVYGGYGWIWQDNSQHTSVDMRDYINQHGLSSDIDYSCTWDELQQEVLNNHPFVILSLITASGHYQAVIGYFKDQYTLIVNDPYGDKNTTNYPSYDGQRCLYDWPGYSNGYENLNTVSGYVWCRGSSNPDEEIYGTDLVADNDDGAPNYSETGTWTTSTRTGHDNGTYRYAEGGNASTAVFTTNIIHEGDYEVFAIYRQDSDRATSVEYTINDSTGTNTVTINQNGANAMVETLLGAYHFEKGASATVTLNAENSTPVADTVISDAIRYRLIKKVEVDNDDGSPAYVETGSWSTSTHKGHNGQTYRNTSAGATGATATFTADLAHTGEYEVAVVGRGWNSYVSSGTYEINTPFGTEVVVDDQRQDNLEWRVLGSFPFHEGTNTIAVNAETSSGGSWVQADAVRLTMKKISFTADNDDGPDIYTETGPWTTSSNTGYIGQTYRWADGGAAATATWKVDLPISGQYEVFALVRRGSDRCANIQYTVDTPSGPVHVSVDQAGTFEVTEISLGQYSFNAGISSVTVDASPGTPTTTNCVISDAVRFDLINHYDINEMKFVNSLQNGGFENDFDNWAKASTTTANIMTSGAHGGAKACEFYHATDYATIWQNPNEVMGETWRTTAWCYCGPGTTSPGFGFRDQAGNVEADLPVPAVAWDFYSVDYLVTDDIDTQAWGTAGNMFIDDVRCAKASHMNWIPNWIWNGAHGADLSVDYFAADGGETNITPATGHSDGGKTWTATMRGDGFIDLADAIGGNPTSCVTYAHIYVTADTEKSNIYLLTGSNDGIKVFLNGTLMLDNDVARDHDYFDPDLDVIAIPTLPQGENRLMLKVKNTTGAYTMSARFCDENGDAVSGLTYDTEPNNTNVTGWQLLAD